MFAVYTLLHTNNSFLVLLALRGPAAYAGTAPWAALTIRVGSYSPGIGESHPQMAAGGPLVQAPTERGAPGKAFSCYPSPRAAAACRITM